MSNIIFTHTDSMDGRLAGYMGHPAMVDATPNIDTLAADGTTFTRCYSNNPICCPSRASMLSGTFTHHCEGWNNFKGLEGNKTLFDHLGESGYDVVRFGKEDYLSGSHSIRARVTPWLGPAGIMRPSYNEPAPTVDESSERRVSTGDWSRVDRAVEAIRARGGSPANAGAGAAGRPSGSRGGRPLFLYLGLDQPHPGFHTSRYYLDRIPEAVSDVPSADESVHPVQHFQQVHKAWRHGFSEQMVKLVRRVYMAMIAEVDEMVGATLSALRESSIADDTMVVFSSDHGEMAMEHRQFHKMSFYEPSARVPLVFSGPGVAKSRRVEALTSLVDLYPTFAELVGSVGAQSPIGIPLDGESLVPELHGERATRREWVLSEFHGTTSPTSGFMLRQGEWKYVAWDGFAPQLFRPDTDPAECHDYIHEYPETAREMDAKLHSIVDYRAVAKRVRAYNRRAFEAFRREHLEAGDYRELMSRVYSGWDHPESLSISPWTDADEFAVETWLGEEDNA